MKALQIIVLSLAVALSGCGGEVDSIGETDQIQDPYHSWGPRNPKRPAYHWPSDKLNPATSNETVGYDVLGAVADWNGLGTPIQMNLVTSGAVDIRIIEGGTANSGWLGLAQIWLDGGHITQGVVTMNTDLLDGPYAYLEYAKQHILCQEAGHIL